MTAALVDQLLEATPVPDSEMETDAVLHAAAEMLVARERVLATASPQAIAKDDPRLLELRARDSKWSELVSAHQARVGALRMAGVRVKAYRQK